MRAVFLARIEPKTLRDLACAIEARSTAAQAHKQLTPEGIESLAGILAAGSRPTIGWWIRELTRQAQAGAQLITEVTP